MPQPFVHLSLHTEFSLLDSTVRIKPMIARAVELGLPAIAMTDQCNVFGLVKFYRAAQSAGVKPIIGSDIWVADEDDPELQHRLILLCQNKEGYRHLSEMISHAFLHRPLRGLPTVPANLLRDKSAGLIALSGAREGQIGQHLVGGNLELAEQSLQRHLDIFGDRFYVEIQRTEREDESRYNEGAIHIAAHAGCPVVATNDVRFLHAKDFDAHEARICIHQSKVLADPKRPRNIHENQYLKSAEEMLELFSDLPEALANSVEIAKRCNLEMRLGTYFLPEFPVPDASDESDHLRNESLAGLEERLAKTGPAAPYNREDYDKRLEHELDVIVQMGFPGYFLIVADFIQWAKDHDIPVGPGRGSGAGSLVAYVLGITDLDPLAYDLLFERFLNPERVSMPDFDVDFCMDRRDEVIQYVAERYGRDQVCQIITFGTMAAKAVVRDTGRVLGHPYGFVDGIAKLIPPTLGINLNEALEESTELKQRVDEEEDVAELMELARSLEGLTRNAGKHAGGVVIAPGPLTDYSPLYCEAGGDSVVTQFDKDDVESVGLVKFDFLGLRTLTIIDWAVKAINQRRQAEGLDDLDISTIPMDDKATFKLLQSCNTTAVFQLESRGMKDLIRRLQPESFDDIVALVALFRPGPLDSGMVDTYVDCKHGRKAVVYPHPELEPILDTTYGVILYQEQVMQIAQVLAGYTLGGADILRRAMGKKKPEEMAKQRKIFVDGSTGRGIDAKLAESIFDLMETFAGYGFNKSHSAAYALLSYQTAYLKAHYPAEFMAAVMSSDMDSTDKVVNFIDDATSMNLEVQQPQINASNYPFTAADPETIVYGLGAVKGVGRSAIDAMLEARAADGPFPNLTEFCRRIDLQKVNRRVLDALIKAGALDALGPNRASLANALPEALKTAEQENRDRAAGQVDLFGIGAAAPTEQGIVEYPEWPEAERLAGERDTLGLYLTGHPINPYLEHLENVVSCRLGNISEFYKPPQGQPERRRGRNVGQPCVVAGLVLSQRRRGETMAFLVLDDQTCRVEVAVYRDGLNEYGELLQKDAILIVEGNLVIDDYSGGYQVKADKILTVDQCLENYARALRIQLNGIQPDLDALRAVLSSYRPGRSQVLVEVSNDEASATMLLGDNWQVRIDESLLESLRQVQGVADARLVYGRT